MRLRLPSLKTSAIALVGLVVTYLVFSWLALPRILQSQAESYIAEKTGHRLTLDRPEFNPFELSLRIANLRLEAPDGQPLLAFRELYVDLSAASLTRRAFVFDGIRLAEPLATVVLQEDGRLNWSPLIEALKDKEDKPDSPLPRIDIESFVLADGQADFADKGAAFATRIEHLDLDLSDVSTLPDDKGQYKISALTALGASLVWQGQFEIDPLAVTGHVRIDGLELARLGPYLKGALPPPAGVVSLATDYRFAYSEGKTALVLDNAGMVLKDLRLDSGRGPTLAVAAIEAKQGRFDLTRQSLALGSLSLADSTLALPRSDGVAAKALQVGKVTVDDLQADLANREASIGRIALTDGQLGATRNARGQVDLVEAVMKALPRPAAKAETVPAGSPWHAKAEKLELAEFSVDFRDEAVKPAANFALDDLALSVDKLSDDLHAPLVVRTTFRARSGGSFDAVGKVVPAEPSVQLHLKVDDLALKPGQPYLASVVKLSMADGKLSLQGDASYGKQGPSFKGGFALRDLRLDESDTGVPFLVWKSLSSREFLVTPAKLEMSELKLDGLDTSLLIAKDKSINVSRLVRRDEAMAMAPPPEAAAHPAQPAYLLNIHRLRVSNSELDFADQSLALPFGTRIHHLRGAINGLSSRPGGLGQLELEGQVDDYGLARAVGQINLFDPADFTDVKVVFRNVEMSRLTPYSATFAGRKIDSGKLSLDLEYKFNKRQMEGDNKVVMDQLILGERVESPDAKSLPLDLAIAILQDSDGRIDLGLPVSGSLDDPQFSYGGIVWKAILNVMGKIATAPFRALASLFGGSEKIDSIAFDAGRARLTPPEREKLVHLAGMLNKRPKLALTIVGVYGEQDRIALQDRQVRRAVAERAGQPLEDREDPGPLSTTDPKVRAALEALFGDRFGSGELAALKEGFRTTNPGQLEEGVAGRMMSRLTGLLREKRTLGADELAQLKGADFYAILFERLRQREPVADERLLALAKARGENLLGDLKAAGAPAERLALAAPEKLEVESRDLPVKLSLGTAALGSAAAAAAQ